MEVRISLMEVSNKLHFVFQPGCFAYILGSLHLTQFSYFQRIHSFLNASFSITLFLFTYMYLSTSPECFTPPHFFLTKFNLNRSSWSVMWIFLQHLQLHTIISHLVLSKHFAYISIVTYLMLYDKYMHAFHAPLVVFELTESKQCYVPFTSASQPT